MPSKQAIACAFLAVALNASATMIQDKGGWAELSHGAQMGYVIAVIDSNYFVWGDDEAENSHKQKIRDCIQGMNTEDFIRIIDMRYEELENYRKPPWSQLKQGLEQVCGIRR